ncbi:HAD-IA family hydrolase [Larsenimonas rhizosphaerae]|uniref:HAD-IA family hydrolase n=1 Tax=Larsenimonas rhizosphaerae TaxID=2944682 RepID=A0AA41ZHJ5_9GAMM|nr:HAD-IA family hydrolase [Larsenimonas rhizosphaerae]MCM2131888.1 HAD-IA family hydrolase [Larsenimonas rhizosphaerae]MCX2524806.1 HAD-IA family hydrolase [Larsenimonas rhizosphaerae]
MIDWSSVDTVLLDMDGTLLDLHFDSHFWLEHLPKRYRELHKLDEAASEAMLSRVMEQYGTLDGYSLEYWSRELDLDIVALKKEVAHLIGFRQDARDFLLWLREQHPRVVLATNADRRGLALKLPMTGLDELVDDIVSSEDIGHPKEAAEFWLLLEERLGFDPTRTLLIDDNVRVLEAAREHGIRHLLGILQPNSQSPRKVFAEFVALDRFAETMVKLP